MSIGDAVTQTVEPPFRLTSMRTSGSASPVLIALRVRHLDSLARGPSP